MSCASPIGTPRSWYVRRPDSRPVTAAEHVDDPKTSLRARDSKDLLREAKTRQTVVRQRTHVSRRRPAPGGNRCACRVWWPGIGRKFAGELRRISGTNQCQGREEKQQQRHCKRQNDAPQTRALEDFPERNWHINPLYMVPKDRTALATRSNPARSAPRR